MAQASNNPSDFHKFPRTSHIHNMGAATRDDLVLHHSDALAIITNPNLIIEEKVDGGNLGVSFDPQTSTLRFQKRGHYINTATEPQYAKLGAWAAAHHEALWNVLGTSRMLYGEWMCARHTVAYDKLPDWFLCFDVLDLSSGSFLSRDARDALLRGSGLHCVRTVHTGALQSLEQLVELLLNTKSAYCTEEVQAEGLYLRVDSGGRLSQRCKLVHPSFKQAIEDSGAHWAKKTMQPNFVRRDLWEEEQVEVEVGQAAAPAVVPDLQLLPTAARARPGPRQQQQAAGEQPSASAPAPRPAAAGSITSKQQDKRDKQDEQGYRVVSKHGVVCLVGPGVEAVAEKLAGLVPERERQMRAARFGPNHHMTLLDPEEVQQLLAGGGGDSPSGTGRWRSIDELAATCHHEIGLALAEWLPLGLGTCCSTNKPPAAPSTSAAPSSTAHFCVVCWPAGHRLRATLGLPRRQQFHITLGFNPSDVHGPSADKGVTALVGAGGWRGNEAGAAAAGALGALIQDLAKAVGGRMTRPSYQAAALLVQALDELDTGKPGPRALDIAATLTDLALDLLRRGDAAAAVSAAGGVAEAAAAAACGRALRARISGRAGGLDEVLMHADEALRHVQLSAASAGPRSPLCPLLRGLRGYVELQRAKSLFGQGRFDEAGRAFRTAEDCGADAPDATEPCGDAAAAGIVTLLLTKVARLFDASSARQGSEACVRRLRQEPPIATPGPAEASQERRLSGGADAWVDEEAPQPRGLPGASGPLDPRERCVVPAVSVDRSEVKEVTLPRNTSWLVPAQLMGSSTPKSRDQVFALHKLGVRLVLTLTEETPLPADWFRGTGVTNMFVPVPNYQPPSVEQMDACMGALEQCVRQGAAALVHCGGGKGRAGTVLACYMVKHGLEPRQPPLQPVPVEPCMSAEEAVRVLRALRPGSIETAQQQSFVGAYSGQLWKRFTQQAAAVEGVEADAGAGGEKRPAQAQGTGRREAGGAGSGPACGAQQQQQRTSPASSSGGRSEEAAVTVAAAAAAAGGGSGWQLPGSYPRTPHLPFSPQVASDDVKLDEATCAGLVGQEVVVTEKLDGGNCMIFQGAVYARSQRQETTHAWFSMAKSLAAGWRHLVPEHLVLVAENMQAVHSIEYTALTSPLYLLAVWDCSLQAWVSWDAVVAVAELLGLPTAPLLFRGSFTSMKSLHQFMEARVQRALPSVAGGPQVEGFVVRQAAAIQPEMFGRLVAKYVRRGHVQTAANWTRTWKQAVVHSDLAVPGPCRGQYETAAGPPVGPAPEQEQVAAASMDTQQQQLQQQQGGGASGAGPSSAGAGCSSSDGSSPAATDARAGGRKQREDVKAGASAAAGAKKGIKLPKLLVLVGLPGSGKSTFAEALVASGRGWVRVCQDECGGSRRTCEAAFGHAALRGSDHGRHVILDRCNATVQDRRLWLDLALIGKRDKGVVAVHFDVKPDECIRRVAARQNHPTLPPGRGAKAVASFAQVLQPPTCAEGYEKVHVVTSFDEANALLSSLGASKPDMSQQDQQG